MRRWQGAKKLLNESTRRCDRGLLSQCFRMRPQCTSIPLHDPRAAIVASEMSHGDPLLCYVGSVGANLSMAVRTALLRDTVMGVRLSYRNERPSSVDQHLATVSVGRRHTEQMPLPEAEVTDFSISS